MKTHRHLKWRGLANLKICWSAALPLNHSSYCHNKKEVLKCWGAISEEGGGAATETRITLDRCI